MTMESTITMKYNKTDVRLLIFTMGSELFETNNYFSRNYGIMLVLFNFK